ncbi:hypothetical protein FE257_006425 [Aspergillus nanangensis]|uniref:DUF924-domain-containing protein n=1 Tax=Aspergillus nanangensis TaxID=2582783 RepID=A0AAD4CXH2_ASPNN|nr:hypothetical protein FE257_006425 [Aspergillus nanangensis]
MPAEPPLSHILLPSVPHDAYTFWFKHISTDQNLILPTSTDQKPWFARDHSFDHACVSQFLPILEAIKTSTPTADQIIDAVNPSSPTDWLGLVILLDQLPRNCYRDSAAAVVFTQFDPLALGVAMQALKADVPTRPFLRYRLALRPWFYLPLMHSEDMHIQDICQEKYQALAEEVNRVVVLQGTSPSTTTGGNGGGEVTPDEAECCRYLAENGTAAQEMCAQHVWFQKLHRDIIVRFGRYPHRNRALGRVSSSEEVRFLEEENQLG